MLQVLFGDCFVGVTLYTRNNQNDMSILHNYFLLVKENGIAFHWIEHCFIRARIFSLSTFVHLGTARRDGLGLISRRVRVGRLSKQTFETVPTV